MILVEIWKYPGDKRVDYITKLFCSLVSGRVEDKCTKIWVMSRAVATTEVMKPHIGDLGKVVEASLRKMVKTKKH